MAVGVSLASCARSAHGRMLSHRASLLPASAQGLTAELDRLSADREQYAQLNDSLMQCARRKEEEVRRTRARRPPRAEAERQR